MGADTGKSIEEIKQMLEDLKKEDPLLKALQARKEEPVEEEPVEEDSPYCIKNGAYIKTSPDGMKAWIYLNPPKKGEPFYPMELVQQFIEENKIVKGVHKSNLAAIVRKHIYEREVLIAQGKEPDNGNDGYFEWFVDIFHKKEPEIREDGTVDYSSMSALNNVAEGDKIAIYHPAVPCEDGYDIFGKAIKSKPSKDLPKLKGTGFSNEADPDVYVATVSGKVSYVNGRLDVKTIHEIRGDVDLTVGKIEFFGDIHITGSVGAGVIVRASRDVTIDGVVESAFIYSGGDVILSRGIQGNQKGKVSAKGSVSAEFIEFAEIEAGGDVRSNSILNSTVFAEGEVKADGKHGAIIGGDVRGLNGVSCVNLGNDTGTKTLVRCGYTAEDYEKYLTLLQIENEAQTKLSDTVDRMSEILKTRRLGAEKNTEMSDKELLALNEKKDEYFKMLDECRTEKEKVAAIIEQGKGSCIKISGHGYLGTTVGIDGELLQFYEDVSYRKYKHEGGRIVSSSL